MSDLQDFTQKNRRHTGNAGITTSATGSGDGGRVNEKGRLRFNDDTDLMEYYNGAEWKPIDSPPVITTIAVDGGTAGTTATIDNEASGTFSLAVNGSLFDTTGAAVTLVGTAETISANSITRNSANLLTAVFTNSAVDVSNSPYTVKVTNGSGLSAELADAISADSTTPVFTNAADTTVSLFDSGRDVGIAAADLCGASGATNFAVTIGSLPSGLSMTSSTGAITGTADAVGTDTTSTFTVTATGDDATATRQFKITVKAPSITSITSTGPGTFSVPTGVSTLQLLLVAGGGSGGSSLGSGAGGGGMLEGTLSVTPGSTIAYDMGAGAGQGSPSSDYHSGLYGSDTTFGPIPGPGATATALGGGYGCGHGGGSPRGDGAKPQQASPNINIGGTGGSGGGTGSADGPQTQYRGGYGNQGDSAGLTGYGNDGGAGGGGNPQGSHNGGGGGGAGGVGEAGGTDGAGQGGDGGAGRVSNITGSPVTYAGGGGGSYYNSGPHGSRGAGAAGPGGGTAGVASGRSSAGGTNTGGGSGCGGYPSGGGGAGGPGIIVIKI